MRAVIILTQDIENKSVNLLATALDDQKRDVIVLKVDSKDCALLSYGFYISGQGVIPFNKIALVIPRTWGERRKEVLTLCKKLESQGVSIFNGTQFMTWSHEKIKQYEDHNLQAAFPTTAIFPREFVKQLKVSSELVISILKKARDIGYPLIFKTNEGTRANGIYKVENRGGLLALLKKRVSIARFIPSDELNSGFLLQKYIASHPNENIHAYYRLNVVGHQAQSAVLFHEEWIVSDFPGCKKLVEMHSPEEKPIPITFFPDVFLKGIIDNQFNMDTVGIDIIQDNVGNFYVLGYHDGPMISAVTDIGQRFANTPEGEKCLALPNLIAESCCITYLDSMLRKILAEAKAVKQRSRL